MYIHKQKNFVDFIRQFGAEKFNHFNETSSSEITVSAKDIDSIANDIFNEESFYYSSNSGNGLVFEVLKGNLLNAFEREAFDVLVKDFQKKLPYINPEFDEFMEDIFSMITKAVFLVAFRSASSGICLPSSSYNQEKTTIQNFPSFDTIRKDAMEYVSENLLKNRPKGRKTKKYLNESVQKISKSIVINSVMPSDAFGIVYASFQKNALDEKEFEEYWKLCALHKDTTIENTNQSFFEFHARLMKRAIAVTMLYTK